MKQQHLSSLFLASLLACQADAYDDDDDESESGSSESGDAEFRAAGDATDPTDWITAWCPYNSMTGDVTLSNGLVCRKSGSSPSFKQVACLPCGVDNPAQPATAWGATGSVSTGWDDTSVGNVTCDGIAVYTEMGREWEVIVDYCHKSGPIDGCLSHPLSDGCSATDATTWRLDGSHGVLCCQQGTGFGAGTNDIAIGDYACTPGGDDCSGMDGFTVGATCTACEGYQLNTSQGGGMDEEGANTGAWGIPGAGPLESSVPDTNPGGEWGAGPYCANGTQDEADWQAGCHHTRYKCNGDLRGLDGVKLDWTNSDECGAD